jgi:hypothetical protein
MHCEPGKGDYCMCFANPQYPPNATPCAKPALKDPGACCADPGWPKTGTCICAAFLCYVNQGGGKDCMYTDQGQNGLETPSTSATGAACCIKGDSSDGYFCSCYDQDSAGSCTGYAKVASCTIDALPPCQDIITKGDTPVASCR